VEVKPCKTVEVGERVTVVVEDGRTVVDVVVGTTLRDEVPRAVWQVTA